MAEHVTARSDMLFNVVKLDTHGITGLEGLDSFKVPEHDVTYNWYAAVVEVSRLYRT